MKSIEVTINPDGTTKIEVEGMQGNSCSIHTEALSRALGGKVLSDEKKPEFFQTQTTKDKDQVKGSW